jgi:ABC-type enterobactin transport system permease subunit
MPRTVRSAALVVLMAALASRLPAQVSPAFNVSISPSIVTVTQGSMTSLTVNIVVNERPQFQFSLSGLPGGVVAQVPIGHPGANTIVLTALTGASTGTFNVGVTVLAGNNPQAQSFVLNVKPLPVVQWEYRMEKAATERELESTASSLGQQSWELVSVVYRERGSNGLPEWTAFFKRQKHPRGD